MPFNVCTHRGMLVATEPCKSNTYNVAIMAELSVLMVASRICQSSKMSKIFQLLQTTCFFPVTDWKGLQLVGGDLYLKEAIAELESRLGWFDVDSFQHDPSRYRS